MSKINLFHYATSELSQDAFLAWLLAWASPEAQVSPMHEYGMKFIQFLYDKCKHAIPRINTIEVVQQDAHIDVQCRINHNEDVLLIEDKAGTVQHSDQLPRYKAELMGRGYVRVLPFYIQTRDQSDYSAAEEAGYTVITRRDLLAFFEANKAIQKQADNQILDDYIEYLSEIEDRTQSYKTLALSDWHWDSWIGFYQALQARMGGGRWGYVANPAGGFLGFWWQFRHNKDCEQYLQLEQEKLCFKIDGETKERCRKVMYQYRDHLVQEGKKEGYDIIKPARLRAGEYMTVAIYNGDYRECNSDGRINMDATVQRLKSLSNFLDSAMEKIGS